MMKRVLVSTNYKKQLKIIVPFTRCRIKLENAANLSRFDVVFTPTVHQYKNAMKL